MVENLHGDTARIDALAIKEYAKEEENDPDLVNAIESIFSTRLTEDSYCGMIYLMKTFSPNALVHNTEMALVSHMKF